MLSPAAMLFAATMERLASEPRRDPTAVTVNLRPWPSVPAVGCEVSSSRRTTSMAFSSSMIFGCLQIVSPNVLRSGHDMLYLLAKYFAYLYKA